MPRFIEIEFIGTGVVGRAELFDEVAPRTWAYDRYARPTIPGQFVPAVANVFGRIVGSADQVAAFYDLSRRLHAEGFKPLQIRRAP